MSNSHDSTTNFGSSGSPGSSGNPNCTGCFLVASPYLTDGNFFRTVVLIIRHTDEGAFGVVINQAGSKQFSELVDVMDPLWSLSQPDDVASAKTSGAENATSKHSNPSSSSHDSPVQQGPSSGENDDGTSAAKLRDQIFVGGPVNGPLLALHSIAGIGEPCGTDVPSSGPDENAGTQTTLHDHPAEPFGSMSIQWADVPAWITADQDHHRILAGRADAKLRFVVGYSGWGPGQLEQELDAGGWLVTSADAASIFESPDEVWEKLVRRCGRAVMNELTPDAHFPDDGQPFNADLN